MALTQSETMKDDFAWLPKLMTAVLLQACRDLQASAIGRIRMDIQKRVLLDGSTKAYTYARSDRNPSRYEHTKAWFLSPSTEVFGLSTVCRVIGIRRARILERMAPFLCPALAGLRKPYVAVEWRNSMKDCKTEGRRRAA